MAPDYQFKKKTKINKIEVEPSKQSTKTFTNGVILQVDKMDPSPYPKKDSNRSHNSSSENDMFKTVKEKEEKEKDDSSSDSSV